MNTFPLLPLNEIYCHYLELYFHATPLSEPRLTRSELERALKLLPAPPSQPEQAAAWLALLAPAWLRGEPEAGPFPQHVEANQQWRAAQRTQREEREAALRQKLERTNQESTG